MTPYQYTLNKLVAIIKGMAEAHQQIESIAICQNVKDLPSGDVIYPLLFIRPVKTVLLMGKKAYYFNIGLINKADKGIQQVEVQSDAQQILTDIYILLSNQQYGLIMEKNVPINNVAEELNSDWTAGAIMELTISSMFDYNQCNIPVSNLPTYVYNTVIPTPTHFLTCETITACTQFQNYVASHAGSGGTGGGNSTIYSFIGGNGIEANTGGTESNVIVSYSLTDEIEVSSIESNSLTVYDVNAFDSIKLGGQHLSNLFAPLSAVSASSYSFSAGSTGNITVQRTGNTITYDIPSNSLLDLTSGTLQCQTLNVSQEAFFSSVEGTYLRSYGKTTTQTLEVQGYIYVMSGNHYVNTNTDTFIYANATSGNRYIYLPTDAEEGKIIYVKDYLGLSNLNTIVIDGQGNNIDSNSQYSIGTPFQCIGLAFHGGIWQIFSSTMPAY